MASPLDILIVGAGPAGTALALFLQSTSKLTTNITVIERHPELRASGQQIDVQGQGIQVMRNAGLLGRLRECCVTESGMESVDSEGKVIATWGVTPAEGERREFGGMTQEYEIMRGDLVRLLYESGLERRKARKGEGEEKKGSLKYEFGKTITELVQGSEAGEEKKGGGVHVLFSDGQRKRYDLVVAADGQSSRTRRLAFGEKISSKAFKPFGVAAAFYNIPGVESDGDMVKMCNLPGRRIMMTRTGGRPVTQVYLMNANRVDKLNRVRKEGTEKLKEAWIEEYTGAGWQSERFVDGLRKSEDFYSTEGGIVSNEHIVTGRVALIGESGYGGTFTGVGTELSLVGGYVLAGELARHPTDVDTALRNYEKVMQAPVKNLQTSPALINLILRIVMPSWWGGVWILNNFIWATSKLRLGRLFVMLANLIPEKEGWKVPEYPELDLPGAS